MFCHFNKWNTCILPARAAIISAITPLLEGMRTLHTLWVEDEILYRIRDVLVVGTVVILNIQTNQHNMSYWTNYWI